MEVTGLAARGFRNLDAECRFAPGLNVLHGPNAQGKTSLLEAIYFCAFGRGLRGRGDRELVGWGLGGCSVRVLHERGGRPYRTDARVELSGHKAAKAFSADGVPVAHMKDLFGRLLVVMFGPQDLRLVKEGPGERRRFMDMEICQLSAVYYGDLKEYHRVLRHRNALLKEIKAGRSGAGELAPWDEQLAHYGARAGRARAGFVERVGQAAAGIYRKISGGEEMRMRYRPSPVTADGLLAARGRDVARGATGDGLHADEIEFDISGRSARSYASQGQQRSAALAAKLAEIELVRESAGTAPVLLLDDVLSELDSARQEFLMEFAAGQQTIMTATGPVRLAAGARVMGVAGGRVERADGDERACG